LDLAATFFWRKDLIRKNELFYKSKEEHKYNKKLSLFHLLNLSSLMEL
jgi:hypothetical protein